MYRHIIIALAELKRYYFFLEISTGRSIRNYSERWNLAAHHTVQLTLFWNVVVIFFRILICS